MTADQLLQNVKDRAALPPAQIGITDTKILQAATEELQAYIAPLLEDANEEFFTDSADVAIVANQSAYDLPTRAMGSALRALKWVDSGGNEGQPLNRIELANIGNYASLASATPLGFYATATQVVILPTPTASGGTLRMYYARRPSALVSDVIAASQHTQVGTLLSLTATVLTLNANHNGFPANTTIDIVQAKPPFKLIAKDVVTTAAAAGTATIAVATDLTGTTIAAGDYIMLAANSYVPQIPLEWHSLLELRAVARLFAMLGDSKGAQESLGNSMMLEKQLLRQAAPRFNANSRKINAWVR